MEEALHTEDIATITITRGGVMKEDLTARGEYYAECYDKDGNLKWADTIENTVFFEGKEIILDMGLQGSATKLGGTFVPVVMGLTLAAGPTSYQPGDQYTNHPGWTEPTSFYTARQTVGWLASSNNQKATDSATNFNILGSATTTSINGCFLAYTGETTPNAFNAAGNRRLLSAGQFSGGPKSISASDQVIVTYTFAL